MNPIQIALLGAGTVATGVVKVLERNQEELRRRAGRGIAVAAVAARNPDKARQSMDTALPITQDFMGLATRADIDIVVELLGGTSPARELVLAAIAAGKHVVTANKALIALHGNEIFAAAQAKGVMVAFEAAVAGGIPIIKALREGLAANRIAWVAGIINGTTNFILSEMPFLCPSSSSSVIMGRYTSCSSKRNNEVGSCIRTLVSSTNNFATSDVFSTMRLVALRGAFGLLGGVPADDSNALVASANAGAGWDDTSALGSMRSAERVGTGLAGTTLRAGLVRNVTAATTAWSSGTNEAFTREPSFVGGLGSGMAMNAWERALAVAGRQRKRVPQSTQPLSAMTEKRLCGLRRGPTDDIPVIWRMAEFA